MAALNRRPGRVAWDAYIFLCCGGLAVVVWCRAIDYLSGLTNRAIEKALPLGRLFVYAVIGLLLLSCIGFAIARTIHGWRATPGVGKALRCAAVVLMCVGSIGAFTHGAPGVERFAQGFAEKIRATADLGAIRAWGSELTVRASGEAVPPELWPRCIIDLSPDRVYAAKDITGVRLDWGGGFIGHYGVVVGPRDLAPPDTSASELIVPLEAGAYLYFPYR